MSGSHFPAAVNDEAFKVPFDVLAAAYVCRFEPAVERKRIVSVHFDFREHVESDAEHLCHFQLDDLITVGLLLAKLIGWKSQNGKPVVAVFIIELL